ncbi:MAG: hypothetical protein ACREV4_15480 [Gammaproteobacteria bacterium]
MRKYFASARTVFIVVVIVLSGCATTSSTRSPGVDLSKIRTVYVIKLGADERGINSVIADELNALGYKAKTGLEEEQPHDVDAVLMYRDHWMWDVTMYMLRLNIEVRDPRNGSLLAEGESYKPSLQRRSPIEMVKEVLGSIFAAAE